MDRLINDLKLESKSYYIPPYPKETYIPEHLKGLKDMIVFVPSNDEGELPSFDDLVVKRFILKNKKGVIISPPGLGLLEYIEREQRVNLNNMTLEDVCDFFSSIVPEDLQLAKEVVMKIEENRIYLKIFGSIYQSLYESDYQSVHSIGSPVVSAIACVIAIVTGKQVVIHESMINPVTEVVEVIFNIVEV